jgi:hypothetical protein
VHLFVGSSQGNCAGAQHRYDCAAPFVPPAAVLTATADLWMVWQAVGAAAEIAHNGFTF